MGKVAQKERKEADMAKRTRKPVTMKIADLISSAVTEIDNLKEEIENWRDNMDGANMTHLPKYDEVSEAADNLESAYSQAEEAQTSFDSLPDEVKGLTVEYVEGRVPKSRADRAGEAGSELRSSAERIREYADAQEKANPDADVYEINECADALENAADELDNVSFPGMY